MAEQSTVVRVRAEVQNLEGLNRLRTAVRGVASEAKAGSNDFNRLLDSIRSLDAAAVRSISGLQRQRDAFDAIRRSANLGSDAFKQATAEIAKLDQKLAQVEGKQAGRGRGARLAQTLGAVASGGVFGGPEGAIGGAIGGIAGGVPGALAGAAIGAQVAGLRQQFAAVAENVAQINKYRIALAGVSKDQADYTKSIADVTQFSKQYLLPLKDTTEQYTQLKASVVGAGLGTRETTQVFRGIAAAVVATGGNAEKLNAALRATAQVFSKGKVSAEELRQQIGERLPGAFTIFAQAIGKTPQQLDKALEDGKVTLADFLKFSEELYKRYGETASILADAPENAGARLKVSLDFATVAYGGFFQVVGAGFQNYLRGLVEFALKNEDTIKRVLTVLAIGFNEIGKLVGGFAKFIVGVFNAAFTAILGNLNTVLGRIEDAINRAKAVQSLSPQRVSQFQEQARRETDRRFGGPGGLFTFIRAGEAEKFYTQRFNQLIDGATKAAKSTGYTDKVQDLLFPEFKPSAFGSAVGQPMAPGAAEGGAEGGRAKNAKKLVDLTKEELDLLKEINRLENAGLDIQAAYKRFQLGELQVSLELERNNIGNNKAIAESLNNQRTLAKAVEAAFQGYGNEIIKALDTQKEINKVLQDAEIKSGKITEEEAKRLLITRQIEDFIARFPQATEDQIARLRAALEQTNKAKTFAESFKASFKSVSDAALDLGNNLGSTLGNAFAGLGDQLAEFVTTGKASFADFTRSVLADLAKIFARAAIFAGLKAIFQGSGIGNFLGFAMGGVMTENGPMPLKRYASGGIANSPQIAMFGEGSRPEAYVPLPDGRSIPVTMSGQGGGVNVVVNVDAKGSDVQGNGSQANALGVAVSSAVKAEIIRQQRPGGLLAGTR
jgi:lambda family phage tail tape measure protein